MEVQKLKLNFLVFVQIPRPRSTFLFAKKTWSGLFVVCS
jgi:hypothetical protein